MPSRTTTSVPLAVLGGDDPEACKQIVQRLPAKLGFAVVIACGQSETLAASLHANSPLPVTEVRDRVRLEPDRVFLIPSTLEGSIHHGELLVEPASSPSAPLDKLLRSAAIETGADTAGVILGGRGLDGVLGIKWIKEAGGLTIAQLTDGDNNEMPRAAIATGLVDVVLRPDEIAERLSSLITSPLPGAPPLVPGGDKGEQPGDPLRDILTLLRVRTGHDFTSYKRATLYRRVARRMQVCHSTTLTEYQQFLREHPAEMNHLLRDFLISVTNFFRDLECFDALAASVIPKLFRGKTSADQVRVWVAGCATGEEAYSLAILLIEHAHTLREPPEIQIFATDIDEDALLEARTGRYPETIEIDVTPARLSRFFTKENGHYRVNPELRELILFTPHNVLRDPPFSRLDLISCRNLMIYLNRDAQERVFAVFHFGLAPSGVLFLGTSESAESSPLFAPLDPKLHTFTRRLAPTRIGVESLTTKGRWHAQAVDTPRPPVAERAKSGGELHHRVVEKYAPPSVLVDGDLDVLHFSEHAGQFLRISGGEPTRQILNLAHPALRLDLRTAIYASRQSQHFETRTVRFEDGGHNRLVELRVRPLHMLELGQHAALITFDELDPARGESTPATDGHAGAELEPVVREIEDELRRTREELRTTIEQYETSLEELKASNEELQAINEELRSATEELETSKEELQSVNEELTTLNHELKIKIDEVSHANSDLQNLMSSTEIAVVFLDRALQIKRFTPRVHEVFNIIPSDVGRPLSHVTHSIENADFEALGRSVLQSLKAVEREVSSKDGRRFLARMLPYRSLEDRIEGVVLTLVDVSALHEAIDARRRSELALEVSEERLRFALAAAPMVVLSLDGDDRITWGYAHGQELAVEHTSLTELFAPGHGARFESIARSVSSSQRGQRIELDLMVEGERRTYDFRIEAIEGGGINAVGFDITPSKRAETVLLEADRRKDEFLATLSHELRNPLTPLKVALDVARLAKGDPAQLEQSRQIMERQVAHLSQLVDELLDLSRITQGKISVERAPVDPSEVVEAALEATRPLILEKRHQLTVSLAPTSVQVFGDASRLTQVLTNLLSNAAKYTPDGGQIDLALSVDNARRRLLISVKDNGIGIDREMQGQIFDIFVQCRDDSGRSRGGLGIGLNLVQRLVQLHGGSVSVRSEGANHGSEFIVELPIEK